MGKRSNLPRRKNDFYVTPAKAVLPLLPHLEHGSTFIEPCAGNGALVEHLEADGHRCVFACDIAPQAPGIVPFDAMDLTLARWGGDYIITNPPWSRHLLHPMIPHFARQRETWLLFDADWMHTRQAIPYLPLLRKVVSIGRVKWFPETKDDGKDNAAWYLFDKPTRNPRIEFYGRT